MKRLLILLAVAFLLAACGGKESSFTTDDVIQKFKDDGLEVGEVSDLENKEFGNTRKEGKRILIPSLGDESGGRLFLFENEDDLKEAKKYYDDISNSGPLFYSHIHQNGNFLFQMNGDMEDAVFKKYADSMDSIE